MDLNKKQLSNFWKKVKKTQECWEWIGCVNKNGYGQFNTGLKMKGAHRVSWEIHQGMIPAGLGVLHHCDNPACVNPAHLFLGDDQANTDDKIRKGRQPRGENHPASKLTWEIVDKMRLEYALGTFTYKELGVEFGVSKQNIFSIIHKKIWQHV